MKRIMFTKGAYISGGHSRNINITLQRLPTVLNYHFCSTAVVLRLWKVPELQEHYCQNP